MLKIVCNVLLRPWSDLLISRVNFHCNLLTSKSSNFISSTPVHLNRCYFVRSQDLLIAMTSVTMINDIMLIQCLVNFNQWQLPLLWMIIKHESIIVVIVAIASAPNAACREVTCHCRKSMSNQNLMQQTMMYV